MSRADLSNDVAQCSGGDAGDNLLLPSREYALMFQV